MAIYVLIFLIIIIFSLVLLILYLRRCSFESAVSGTWIAAADSCGSELCFDTLQLEFDHHSNELSGEAKITTLHTGETETAWVRGSTGYTGTRILCKGMRGKQEACLFGASLKLRADMLILTIRFHSFCGFPQRVIFTKK